MFSHRLKNSSHTRQFVIFDRGQAGWEAREELDSEVIRLARYFDWHRVERIQREFERQVETLRQHGWVEV